VNLTADHIAAAIVAACRETGDDPIRTASGGLGTKRPTNRARHYALHALLHCFPDVDRHSAARMVGCPGSPAQFWNASWHQVAKPRASGFGHVAGWFDDVSYARVIAAIEEVEEDKRDAAIARQRLKEIEDNWETLVSGKELDSRLDKLKEPKEPQPYKPGPLPAARPRQLSGTLEPSGYRPPRGTLKAILDDDDDARPVIDRGQLAGAKKTFDPFAASGKQALRDELRRAVENTAKLPTPKE
jgi:hypothetical protein